MSKAAMSILKRRHEYQLTARFTVETKRAYPGGVY